MEEKDLTPFTYDIKRGCGEHHSLFFIERRKGP